MTETRNRSVLAFLPAVVLLATAVLKLHSIANSPFGLLPTPFAAKHFTVILILFEIILGSWILSHWHAKYSRRFAIATFAVFATVSGVMAVLDYESCNCFGQFRVAPQYSSLLSILCLLILYFERAGDSSPFLFVVGASLVVVLVPICLIFSQNFKASDLSSTGVVIGEYDAVLLKPKSWVGKKLPLAHLVNGPQNYMQGKATLVLVSSECIKCQLLIQDHQGSEFFPTYIEISGQPKPTSLGNNWRHLDQRFKWFAELPCTIDLEDGVVTRVDKS